MSRMRLLCPLAIALAVAFPPAAGAAAPSLTADMPPEVQSWRELILSKERYLELADRWRAYLERHPKSAVAHVQLARALRYSGAPEAERSMLIRKAYALDPKCPEALDAMAMTILGYGKPLVPSLEKALELDRRAASLAPGWPDVHLDLWTLATDLGRTAEARQYMRTALETGAFKPPILDFAYNMLQSAEPKAVVFTNGDNDTYPPIALQVTHDIRTDVLIVNLSLLNLESYSASVWSRAAPGSAPFTQAEVAALRRRWESGKRSRPFSTELVAALVRKVQEGSWKGPVYFAITVAPGVLECCGQSLETEGILLRLKPEPKRAGEAKEQIDAEKTVRLFRNEFRLDSASDLGFDWRPEAAAYMMMTNYAAVLSMVAEKSAQAGRMDDARYALRTGLHMMKAEGNGEMVETLGGYWKELEPDSREARQWSK